MKAALLAAVVLLCASIATAQSGDAVGGPGGRIEGTNEIFGGDCGGDIITEAPFFDLECVEQQFPTGSTPNDCNGNGIPDRYDDQPCNEGETGEAPGPCADNPCEPSCPGSQSAICREVDPETGDPSTGNGIPDCPDEDDDDVCDQCDPDHQRVSLEGGRHYCEDADGNDVCDDCEHGNCWVRIIDKLWWLFLFQNTSPSCEYYVLTLDPNFGPYETYIPGPIVNLTIDTCFQNYPLINNFRTGLRATLSWVVSIYFWYLWWRFFYEM